jgi:hypothetical protein
MVTEGSILRPGEAFGDLEIDRFLERDALTETYLCRQNGAKVALRCMKTAQAPSPPAPEAFVAEVKGYRIGDPMDEDTYIGAVTRRAQLDVLKAQVADARKHGAVLRCGGRARISRPVATRLRRTLPRGARIAERVLEIRVAADAERAEPGLLGHRARLVLPSIAPTSVAVGRFGHRASLSRGPASRWASLQ